MALPFLLTPYVISSIKLAQENTCVLGPHMLHRPSISLPTLCISDENFHLIPYCSTVKLVTKFIKDATQYYNSYYLLL